MLCLYIALPTPIPPPHALEYYGKFQVQGGVLVDSLDQLWHIHGSLADGSYEGEVILEPFKKSVIPFVFQPFSAYYSKGQLGECRVLSSSLKKGFEESKLLKYWEKGMAKLSWSAEAKSLVGAFFLGKSKSLPAELKVGMQRLGLSHLMAVSGFHLGMAWGFVALIARAFPYRYRIIFQGLGLWVLWVYVNAIHFPLSAVRAMIMITLLAVLNLGHRRQMGLQSILLATGIMVLYQPQWVGDVGFQLSVSAVLGISILMQLKPPRRLVVFLIPVVAQWSTLWVSVPTFHQFPLLFLPSNVLLTPILLLMYPYTLLSVMGGFVGFYLPFPESIITYLARVPDTWSWSTGYFSYWGSVGLMVNVSVGILCLKYRWPVLGIVTCLATFYLLKEGEPTPAHEISWHSLGRGLAQVEVKGDTALIQGTAGAIHYSFYWDVFMKPYFDSRGVQHFKRQPLGYKNIPERIRIWSDTCRRCAHFEKPKSPWGTRFPLGDSH